MQVQEKPGLGLGIQLQPAEDEWPNFSKSSNGSGNGIAERLCTVAARLEEGDERRGRREYKSKKSSTKR